MIDYILTVAVSVSAGIENLTSAVPVLRPYTVELCLAFILLLMVANLRGLKESGKLFMIPTYAFIVSILIMTSVGLFNQLTGHVIPALPPVEPFHQVTESLTVFLILRF